MASLREVVNDVLAALACGLMMLVAYWAVLTLCGTGCITVKVPEFKPLPTVAPMPTPAPWATPVATPAPVVGATRTPSIWDNEETWIGVGMVSTAAIGIARGWWMKRRSQR